MTLPFENDTSTISNKMASANLKHNRLQTRLSILAITLSTILIVGVLLLMMAIANVNFNRTNPATGSYHAMVSPISSTEFDIVIADKRIESGAFTASVGTNKNNEVQLNLSYGNEAALELCGLSIEEGHLPQKENEILIERDYLQKLHMQAEIGDSITLNGMDDMDFIISGYLKTSASGTNRTLYGALVSEAYFTQHEGWNRYSTTLLFRIQGTTNMSRSQIEAQVSSILKDAAITEALYINEAYINLSRPSFVMIATIVMALIIIIAAGTLVIYCIFYINIMNSIREYGQLRTIGMTGNQIKALVFKQARVLCLRSIPIGLLIGTIFSYAMVPEGFLIKNLIWTWPLSAVLVFITVRFSVAKPAKIAAGITPMEAVRYNSSDIQLSTVHHPMKRITPASLAWAQIKRNKKKHIFTSVSLAIVGVLLMSISAILSSMDAGAMSRQGFPYGQFMVRISDEQLINAPLEQVQAKNPLTPALLEELQNISGVEQISVYQNIPVSLSMDASESDNAMITFEKETVDFLRDQAQDNTLPNYEKITVENGLIIGRPDSFEKDYGFKPKVGQDISVKLFDGLGSKNITFTIVGILNEQKALDFSQITDTFMIPVSNVTKLISTNSNYEFRIQATTEMEQEVEIAIEQLLQNKTNLQLNTLSYAIAQNTNFIQGMKIALVLVVSLIGCFALMNLANTILTGVVVRKREFATLRSVGMSQKQLVLMVCLEGIIASSYGLILSVVLGSGLGFGLYTMLKNGVMSYLEYQFPLFIAMSFIFIVLLCTLSVSGVALKGQQKYSLVEQLK